MTPRKEKKPGEEPKEEIEVPPDIRKFFKALLIEESEEIDNAIAFEVETKFEERFAIFEEKLKERDDKIEQLEREIALLKKKDSRSSPFSFSASSERPPATSFAGLFGNTVTTVRQQFERQASPSILVPTPEAPAQRTGASSVSSQTSRPTTPTPTPSTTPAPLTPEEIRRQFTLCKKKILISPVTEGHIKSNFQMRTGDINPYSQHEILFGASHEQARMDAAIDFFRDEILFEHHEYKIDKVEYHSILSKTTLIGTLKTE